MYRSIAYTQCSGEWIECICGWAALTHQSWEARPPFVSWRRCRRAILSPRSSLSGYECSQADLRYQFSGDWWERRGQNEQCRRSGWGWQRCARHSGRWRDCGGRAVREYLLAWRCHPELCRYPAQCVGRGASPANLQSNNNGILYNC